MGDSRQPRIGVSGGAVDLRIDIDGITAACVHEGQRHGWEVEFLEADSESSLVAMRRPGAAGSKGLYVSAGIHGDEPAPPLAVLRLLKQNAWPEDLNLWVCPCLNPGGFRRNRRENAMGVDLNRQYHRPDDVQPETARHIDWLDRQGRFDAALCLHEDWESQGFYLYELLRDEERSLARSVLDSVAGASSIDRADQIDGMPAEGGMITPRGDYASMMEEWPEAIWLMERKTELCYTFETSSADPLILRVAAQVRAVNAAARALSRGGSQ